MSYRLQRIISSQWPLSPLLSCLYILTIDMYTYWTTWSWGIVLFSHRLDPSQRVVYRIYLSLIFQRACSCCLHKLEKIRGSPLRALSHISGENGCAVVTRNKELLYTASSHLQRSSVLETHGVQLLLIQRVLRGLTDQLRRKPECLLAIGYSCQKFVARKTVFRNYLDTGLVMSRRMNMQPARKNCWILQLIIGKTFKHSREHSAENSLLYYYMWKE